MSGASTLWVTPGFLPTGGGAIGFFNAATPAAFSGTSERATAGLKEHKHSRELCEEESGHWSNFSSVSSKIAKPLTHSRMVHEKESGDWSNVSAVSSKIAKPHRHSKMIHEGESGR